MLVVIVIVLDLFVRPLSFVYALFSMVYLLLKAMLEWLIANPSITETQTTRMALL